jgi:hypothetical protein
MRKREGIEPRNENAIVGADVVSITEGEIKGVQSAMTLANPPGSESGARMQKGSPETWESLSSPATCIGSVHR